MGIDHQEVVEQAQEAREDGGTSRLNIFVALTVALLATFSGIFQVKDENIVQAMDRAQADRIDYWGYYQARNLRQEIAEATVLQLELAKLTATPAAHTSYDAAIQRYKDLAASQQVKKNVLEKQAREAEKRYDDLNFFDDQFDLAEAMLAIAIAMLAVTALTQYWPLYFISLLPVSVGMAFGLSGLVGGSLHISTLVKWLS